MYSNPPSTPARAGLRSGALVRGICAALALAVVAYTAGCASLRSGGAPSPSTDLDADYKRLQQENNKLAQLDTYFTAKTADARNAVITARLELINIRYIDFLRTSQADRQSITTATELIEMGLSITGAAMTPAGTKTVLAALAAATGGGKSIFEKNYYFEQTMAALASAMNARRQQALIPILSGMLRPIEDYSIGQAVADLQAFYEAGTYLGGIEGIRQQAGEATAAANVEIKKISKLKPATPAQIVTSGNVGLSLFDMAQTNVPLADQAKWRAVYRAAYGEPGPEDWPAFQTNFKAVYRDDEKTTREIQAKLSTALTAQGLLKTTAQ